MMAISVNARVHHGGHSKLLACWLPLACYSGSTYLMYSPPNPLRS